MKFLSLCGISLTGAVSQSFISGCESDTTKSTDKSIEFDISSEQALSAVGGSVKKVFGEHNSGKALVVVRTADDAFKVLTSVCSHLGCEVNLPEETGGNLVCPCHSSEFALSDGSVIKGPADSPLRQFVNSFDPTKSTLTIWF